MIDADRALQRTSQLRTLCLTLQEAGRRLRLSQRAAGLVGSALEGVYWAHVDSKTPSGYARYFLCTTSGRIYEASRDMGLSAHKTLPLGSTPLADFTAILRGPKITALHQEREGWGELVLTLDSGHAICLVSTFDGEHPGNNLVLEAPAEFIAWRDELSRDYVRLL